VAGAAPGTPAIERKLIDGGGTGGSKEASRADCQVLAVKR